MMVVAAVWSDVWGAGGHDVEDATGLGVHHRMLAVGHCETNHVGLEITVSQAEVLSTCLCMCGACLRATRFSMRLEWVAMLQWRPR
jgi:hypothetical protein